ncbi:sensor histidine kinase [Evansella sp. AB-rgal1]|uniref:cache domain-containing sensor histidine kinase n=1 Tax=Evansella sp. AB-rgal1 TaxID=3242696 RepID=UPI00359E2594
MKLYDIASKHITIGNKLIFHFLLISILPSILLAVFVDWTVNKVIEQQVNENTMQLIEKVNRSVENHIENVQNMTYFISLNPKMEDFFNGNLSPETMDPDEKYEVTKFLQSFTTLYPEIAGILIVNDEGQYISNELYSRSAVPLTQETWYRQAANNQGIATVIGQPNNRRITSHVNYTDNEVISVVRAIMDPTTREAKGVVLIDLKLRVIAETVKDVRLGKTGYLMVLDQQGDTIYSPTHSILQHLSFQDSFDGNYGTFTKDVNGDSYQIIFRKSTFTDWNTVGVFSTEDAVAEVQQIRFSLVTFVFFVCFFGITMSYFLSHSISKPISKLMRAMQKAESGDLTIQYKGAGRDEVGKLGRSFNSMIFQINKLMKLTEQQERKKREAELHSLQANIKPHFLYNTLDTIQWMARKKNAFEVAEMVGSLSKLFRIGLSKGGTIIPLREEIEHIKSYLQIQSTRYKNKLNYEIVISPETEELSVLKIVLQPIVENAIYHGIKERRGPGLISIETELRETMLVITIRDNGKGISCEKLHELRSSLDVFLQENKQVIGYGIVNVHARLKLTFGESYGLQLDSEENEGTVVTIYHPILRRGDHG